ncbi:hypothetical protein BDV98DRAFT_135147 [Pterulicium gracile]|uniref:GmrSD restriction endonucleases C-terminal domain-containing protein n=1 Tax=Pterulicium gracile TaxID=1884261 RepID=A0A5C3QHT5_9AGAR|nr:hypothetical protein BDV98DRAFT_135147 [Pterula gracilis]
MRFSASLLAACTVGITMASPVFVPSRRAFPEPVDAATATRYLSELFVQAESNSPAYDRDLFDHWSAVEGACNARETVLERDGENVVTDAACKSTSGTWLSAFDGVTATDASEISIDHMIPLKEAWVSGARLWTDAEREAFANDLVRPQLIAVTVEVNSSKGDKDPAEWMPPVTSYACTYVRAWIEVKHHYDLSVDEAEKEALEGYLADC